MKKVGSSKKKKIAWGLIGCTLAAGGIVGGTVVVLKNCQGVKNEIVDRNFSIDCNSRSARPNTIVYTAVRNDIYKDGSVKTEVVDGEYELEYDVDSFVVRFNDGYMHEFTFETPLRYCGSYMKLTNGKYINVEGKSLNDFVTYELNGEFRFRGVNEVKPNEVEEVILRKEINIENKLDQYLLAHCPNLKKVDISGLEHITIDEETKEKGLHFMEFAPIEYLYVGNFEKPCWSTDNTCLRNFSIGGKIVGIQAESWTDWDQNADYPCNALYAEIDKNNYDRYEYSIYGIKSLFHKNVVGWKATKTCISTGEYEIIEDSIKLTEDIKQITVEFENNDTHVFNVNWIFSD